MAAWRERRRYVSRGAVDLARGGGPSPPLSATRHRVPKAANGSTPVTAVGSRDSPEATVQTSRREAVSDEAQPRPHRASRMGRPLGQGLAQLPVPRGTSNGRHRSSTVGTMPTGLLGRRPRVTLILSGLPGRSPAVWALEAPPTCCRLPAVVWTAVGVLSEARWVLLAWSRVDALRARRGGESLGLCVPSGGRGGA